METEKRKRNKIINYTTDIHTRLKKETFEDFKKICYSKEMTYSNVLRILIEDFVKENIKKI